MAKQLADPLAGITSKTTKEELIERLRSLATRVRKEDRQEKARLQVIEDRLKAKGRQRDEDLLQVIGVATGEEWTEAIEFLEEFEDEGLLPTALARFLVGGRTLMGLIENGNGGA